MNERIEWLKCSRSAQYFIDSYVFIENATDQGWVRFRLWPAQFGVLRDLAQNRQLVILKARQLGLTWLILSYALWLIIFRPGATILLFSLRDDEAKELLKRLTGIYDRLPDWMKARGVVALNAHEWRLSNGSRALCFPTTGGRSYTGTLVIVDESDFIPKLDKFLNAVKPTVDAGGQLVLISTVDKRLPLSTFKLIFQAAIKGLNQYKGIFLPWSSRPERTPEWYERISTDMYSQSNSYDDLWQEYPATIEQALSPLQKDKRIPLAWIEAVAVDAPPLGEGAGPDIPGMGLYELPREGRRYVVGADSAEGNPNSDDSVACVLDAETWRQVAVLAGKFEPSAFADYIDKVGAYYNGAPCMAERNNHGHATILAMSGNGKTHVLTGHDNKPGWLSNQKGKRLLYDLAAESIRDGAVGLADMTTRVQLSSIEASTLRAPDGLNDDYADAFALALAGLRWGYVEGAESGVIEPVDALDEYERGAF